MPQRIVGKAVCSNFNAVSINWRVQMSTELYVERDIFTPESTIGRLFIAGIFECFTLEPPVRPAGVKVDGKTAIPDGRYPLTIDESERFGRPMPHVNNVPEFAGIRIHTGNTAVDTEGCTLLGTTHEADVIVNSRVAFDAFFPKLESLLKQGDVFITYENTVAPQQQSLGIEAKAS
jgi:hypothetical protein